MSKNFYAFPIMKNKDIITCLKELEIPMTLVTISLFLLVLYDYFVALTLARMRL
jgi:hypothetical protein